VGRSKISGTVLGSVRSSFIVYWIRAKERLLACVDEPHAQAPTTSVNTLLIFAKESHQAKQRLRAALPANLVTRLATAFLRDTLVTAASLEDVVIRIAYAPRSSEAKFAGLLQEFALTKPHGLLRQRGRALGARLEAGFKDTFAAGATRVIAIGTDSPSMPAESIRMGFELLTEHDCVLGPTLDGGYYLIGLSKPWPRVFRGIEWSENSVYRETMEIIRRDGLSFRELPLWYDVDSAEDLEFLVRDINQFRLAGDEERARHTESVLARLLKLDA
jgi:rSAM/selenodomain-associated transferase 1